MSNHPEEFRAAMLAEGLNCPGVILQDGLRHRFKCGDDKEAASWYILYPADPIAAGAFGCWKRQIKGRWKQNGSSKTSPQELAELKRRWAEAERLAEAEAVARHERMAIQAQSDIAACECVVHHDYLSKKQCDSHGLWLNGAGDLVVPLQDAAGKIWSYQTVDPAGDKLFFPGGRVAGCFFFLSNRKSGPLCICEGYATGASIFEATGFAVACAMNCGNLLKVCEVLRGTFPDREFLICADNDHKTEGNPGLTKGTLAAKVVKALLVLPQFPPEMDCPSTDFNDLRVAGGLQEVKTQILLALEYPIARPIGDLQPPPRDDPDELLKHRYLCRGGGLLVVGPTGMGKSSFVLQMLALLANGKPAFNIEPTRPLRAIYIQAENDDGDISEMRDGIAKGLEFNESQRKNFFERVIVLSENTRTGRNFFDEVVIPLIISNPDMDLLVIDPALSYLGGEAKDQKAVGEFLRTMLAPVLARYRMAGIVVHHTNKPPSGNQKSEWTTSEMAYLGSGPIEWANWSRAVLALQGTSTPGVFRLNAAKRGARLAWKSGDEKAYHQLIKHFKSDDIICWLPANEDEVEPKGDGGRPRKAELSDFVGLLETTNLSTAQWMAESKSELAISRATFYRLLEASEKEGLVLKSKINGKWTKITPQSE